MAAALMFFLPGCGGGDGWNVQGPGGPALDQAAAPSVDRPSGYFVDPILVTVSPGAAGATVEITTDTSVPSCGSGPAYSFTVIPISDTMVIKAISCESGFSDSAILESTFTRIMEDIRVYPATAGTPTPIQNAVAAAGTGDIIYIEPGIYTENGGELVIDKPITLIGAGSGADSTVNTIIKDAPSNQNIIAISTGGTATTLVVIRNVRVTGSLGPGGNEGAGIEIRTADGHIEIDNVAAVGNSGNGISFDVVATDTQDIILKNSDLSFNGNVGFRVPSSLGNIDGLIIDNCVFEGNTSAGAKFYSMAINPGDVTNISITNSTFRDNAVGIHTDGDVILTGFGGNAMFSTVSIESSGSESGMRISGNSSGSSPDREGAFAAGDITLSYINISGMQQTWGTYPSGALTITRFLGLSSVQLDDVVLSSTAPNGLFLGTITAGNSPNIESVSMEGSFSDADLSLGKHGNSSSYKATEIDIDASGVAFTGAGSDADIEARVNHYTDDAALGLITWTSP